MYKTTDILDNLITFMKGKGYSGYNISKENSESVYKFIQALSEHDRQVLYFKLSDIDIEKDEERIKYILFVICILIRCGENPLKLKNIIKSISKLEDKVNVKMVLEYLVVSMAEEIKEITLLDNMNAYEYDNDGYINIDPYDTRKSFKILTLLLSLKQSLKIKTTYPIYNRENIDLADYIQIPEDLFDVSIGRSYIKKYEKLDGIFYSFLLKSNNVLPNCLNTMLNILENENSEYFDDLESLFNIGFKGYYSFMDESLGIYNNITLIGTDDTKEYDNYLFFTLYDLIYTYLVSEASIESHYLDCFPNTQFEESYFPMEVLLPHKDYEPIKTLYFKQNISIKNFSDTDSLNTFYSSLTSIIYMSICNLIATNICNGIHVDLVMNSEDEVDLDILDRLMWLHSIIKLNYK